MSTLANKTLFITGASRGIGRAIALRAARDGANVVIAAKTTAPDPKLPGTIYDAADEIEREGGRALACVVDVKDEKTIYAAVEKAVSMFGGIDILVNNASAISLTGTMETPLRRFDHMLQINTRGTYACSQACIPHLVKSKNPHILNNCPPLNLDTKWVAPHVAYTIAKYGMSLCALGMAEELRPRGIAVNALWPRTAIATAAVQNLLGGDEAMQGSRTPEIMADAAHVILTRSSRECTGNFFIDEDVLTSVGVTDFAKYAVNPNVPLIPDYFL